MAARDEIVDFLTDLLDPQGMQDYGPNGLQVPGRGEVRRVVTGVSANRALLTAARDADADLVLVHHGLFWGRVGPLDRMLAERLRLLLTDERSLVAFHLPLDAHPEVGNNALLADALGLVDRTRFARHSGTELGVAGRLPGPLSPADLSGRLAELCQQPLHLPGGPDRIERIGIVSGGAADDVHEAAALGLDAFITGEPEERSQGDAAEEGIHLFAAGHHATERFGVRRVGELLADRFDVEHRFVDVANPV